VGHSMGGNVAMLYAGSRPERIRKLVNLEGFGMPATQPRQAPKRYAKWMDELKAFHRGDMALKDYDSVDGVAARLMKTNKRLPADKADWLARHWAQPDEHGRWRILGDAAHKITNANLYRVDEVLEIYKAITAPVLAVEASDDSLGQWWQGRFTLAEYHERPTCVRQTSTTPATCCTTTSLNSWPGRSKISCAKADGSPCTAWGLPPLSVNIWRSPCPTARQESNNTCGRKCPTSHSTPSIGVTHEEVGCSGPAVGHDGGFGLCPGR
jgi:hypothetical protein